MSDVDKDGFETAVEEVEGAAQIVRELRSFPVVPKGTYRAKCLKAELKEREFEGHKSMNLSLTWELDETYESKNEDGEVVHRNFRVFDNLGLYFGPKAKLHKTFKELTNKEIAPLVVSKKFKKDGKDFVQETFQFKAFEEMEADITVTHKTGTQDPTKIYANIGAYTCDEATQKKNAALVFDDGAAE